MAGQASTGDQINQAKYSELISLQKHANLNKQASQQ